MVEITEESGGFIVHAERFHELFRCRDNALLAARIMATAEAVLSQRDVGVFMPARNGERVCVEVVTA